MRGELPGKTGEWFVFAVKVVYKNCKIYLYAGHFYDFAVELRLI